VLEEDIENARQLIKISEIDKSYRGDRSELTIEKEVMILIDDDKEKFISKWFCKSLGEKTHNNVQSIGRVKILITKSETKHHGIPLYYELFPGAEELSTYYGSFKAKIDTKADLFESLMKIGMFPITEDHGTFYYYA
jgi:hypothetical protein